jgi:hypothetical protein
MSSGLLHLDVIARKHEESETQGIFLSEIKYDNVKTLLCQEWRIVLGKEQSPEDSLKIVFLEEVLRLADKSSFPHIDRTDDSSLR